ncbi:MAG: nicotinate-nucleotide--dimethylbenzimidazole phosphoribosyltransferase [Bacteroidales bacterium]|jgi:nicotinate-nucleotide--dimethylbenzimidazole phosphoribosyltransferase
MTLKENLQNKINNKTKPLGSLGLLENIALQIGLIQETLTPELKNPAIIVFAGDHGITDEGVSPFPKVVTQQMVLNFLSGGAAINVFCKQNNINLKVVDAGVDGDFEKNENLIVLKIKNGTNNIIVQPAMTLEECKETMKRGEIIVDNEFKNDCNIIGFGEMGIGNTSAAALLMSKYCNLPIDVCTGRGTGLDNDGLKRKTEVLQKAIQKYPEVKDSLEILSTFGGFEIAMMAGAILKAAELKMAIMIDGFIATSALLAAYNLNQNIINNCIFCHTSNEQGHRLMLDYFKAKPILNIDLRLGEGTGAALAYPVIHAAVNFLNNMASFESAGVSNKD